MFPELQLWSGDTVLSEYMPLYLYLGSQSLFIIILSVCLCKVSALSNTKNGDQVSGTSLDRIKTLFAERKKDLNKLVSDVEISRLIDGKFSLFF